MTALSDAERAVVRAQAAVVRELNREAAQVVDALIAAVRHHDAEIVRADTGHIRHGSAEEYAIRHAALIEPTSPMSRAADRIDPKEMTK